MFQYKSELSLDLNPVCNSCCRGADRYTDGPAQWLGINPGLLTLHSPLLFLSVGLNKIYSFIVIISSTNRYRKHKGSKHV